MEVLKVKVIGGSKRKVLTRVRYGDAVERYEVRWRVYFMGGEMRELRQRFDRAIEADQFIRVLGAVGLPGSTWRMGDDGRPYDASARPVVPEEPQGPSVTMWDALQMYRSATWRTASANGRKTHAYVLRAMARVTTDRAPAIPPAAEAYLNPGSAVDGHTTAASNTKCLLTALRWSPRARNRGHTTSRVPWCSSATRHRE